MKVWSGTEHFDAEALNDLIPRLKDIFGDTMDEVEIDNMRAVLVEYQKKSKDGKRRVNYTYARGCPEGVGRVYAVGGVGMQNFKRKLRHTLAHNYCDDIDMVNAHPSILLQLAKKHGLPCSGLEDYVSHREERLGDLVLSMGMTREDAKKEVLKILNYGGRTDYASPPAWLVPLAAEFEVLRHRITDLYPDIKAVKAGREYNLDGSVMNLVICTIERKCMFRLVEFLKNSGFRVDVLCHDGCMVRKGKKAITQSVLDAATEYVAAHEGYRLPLAVKPMTDIIHLEPPTHQPLPQPQPPAQQASLPTGVIDLILATEGTDYQIAEIISTLAKGRFVKGNRSWWVVQPNGRWVRDEKATYLRLFISTDAYKAFLEADMALNGRLVGGGSKTERAGLEEMKEEIGKHRKKLQNKKAQDNFVAMCEQFLTDPKFEDRLDADPFLLGFENGVFDARQMRFREVCKEDYLTFSVGYEYDAQVDTTNVESILRAMMPDLETYESLMRCLAACVFGGNKEENVLVFEGEGGNGKTLLYDFLLNAMGDYFATLPDTFYTLYEKSSTGPQPEIVKLRGKRMAVTDEVAQDVPFISKKVKGISGGAKQSGRECHSNVIVEFKPQYTPIINTN